LSHSENLNLFSDALPFITNSSSLENTTTSTPCSGSHGGKTTLHTTHTTTAKPTLSDKSHHGKTTKCTSHTTATHAASGVEHHQDGHNDDHHEGHHKRELIPRERRLGTSSSPREDIQNLLGYMRDTTKKNDNTAVKALDFDAMTVQLFDLACTTLAGVWEAPFAKIVLSEFFVECLGIVGPYLATVGPEAGAAGAVGWAATAGLGFAASMICSIAVKQTLLTTIPGTRAKTKALKSDFCHKAKCVVFTDVLSSPIHCGHCDNVVCISSCLLQPWAHFHSVNLESA